MADAPAPLAPRRRGSFPRRYPSEDASQVPEPESRPDARTQAPPPARPATRESSAGPPAQPGSGTEASRFSSPLELLSGYTRAAARRRADDTGASGTGPEQPTEARPAPGPVDAQPDPDARARPEAQPTPQPTVRPEVGVEPETRVEPDTRVEPETGVEEVAEVEAEVRPAARPKSGGVPEPQVEAPVRPETGPKSGAEPGQAQTPPEGEPEAEPPSAPGPEAEGEPAAKTAPATEDQSRPDPEGDVELDSEDEYPWTAAELAAEGWTTADLQGAGWTADQLAEIGWPLAAGAVASQTGAVTIGPGESAVPAFVEYRSGEPRRLVLGTLFMACTVLAVLAAFDAVQHDSSSGYVTASALAVLAGAAWWGLLNWAPRTVTVAGGILEVAHGPDAERYDLRDPDLDLCVGTDPRSRHWATTVRRQNGTTLKIRAHQVRPEQFSALIAHHRGEQQGSDAGAPAERSAGDRQAGSKR